MIANLIHTISKIPLKKLFKIIFLSIILTIATAVVVSDLLYYRLSFSLTFNGLEDALKNILGYGRYASFQSAINILLKLLWLPIFLVYFSLFYKSEARKLYDSQIEKLIVTTKAVASGNFQQSLQNNFNNNLDELSENINEIVKRLQRAIEDERHLDNMKNELITNVSHDLRTPLTSIIGYLRLIEDDNYKDEVVLRHYTNIAYEKSLRMEKLLNELFEYTRLQDSRIILESEQVNLEEMISELIVQNEYYLQENELLFRENYTSTNPVVNGDGNRLARVFENLLLNAIQYGKDGKYIDIELSENEQNIIVNISNYGNPISKIDLPHLFDRFYRVDKSRATHTGGTGLGLSIAKSIVLRHEGKIFAESSNDKTSFIVILPKLLKS